MIASGCDLENSQNVLMLKRVLKIYAESATLSARDVCPTPPACSCHASTCNITSPSIFVIYNTDDADMPLQSYWNLMETEGLLKELGRLNGWPVSSVLQ